MAGARAFLFLAGCGMFLFIALAIGVGLAVYLMNKRRIMGALGPPAQALAILEDWAADERCELLKVDWSDGSRDHPFAADRMRAFPVNPWVNNARHEDAGCLEPMA
jgi:hypothetical protein